MANGAVGPRLGDMGQAKLHVSVHICSPIFYHMATDIIDLTATRSGDIVVAVSDDTDPGEKSASKRPKRKAKKRKSTIHSREHSKPNDLNSVSVEASSTSTPSEFVADLFYVDIASGSKPQPIAPSTVLDASQPDLPRLLLPSHVSVFGEDLVEMEQPVQTDVVYGDDDYIQYLDLDDRKVECSYFVCGVLPLES